ncbi:hypothetical protein ED733_002019 [Metarhizium rileyi]|uniref:Uncharacterized protein n=1 Tax=Metarhizium rileyi (strain RCEF 4871) TaxID=1649241 RepID=A0A5C6G1P2_METRR|nr:hypothetical protein ED733_002019 [Metarhizium rileyi]
MLHRSRTPGSSQSGASRYGRFERHARLPIDRSGRSPSLTSIVDMYRRPSTAKGSRQPPQTAGSFYYDYSEDFDRPVASHHDVNEQISVDTATIQDDDDHNYGEFAVEAKPGSHGSHYAGVDESISQSCSGLQHGAADQEEPTPEPNLEEDTTKSIVVGDTELSNLIATRRLSRSAPAGSQPSNSASDGLLSDRQEATVNRAMLSKSDTSQSSRAVKDKPRPDCRFNAVDNRQQSSDIARCTLDPTLPDFASIFSSFDLLGKSPCFKSTDISAKILLGNGDADSINSSSHNPDIPRYCRNVAAVRVSTAAMNDESEHLRDESMHEQELDILSPEPISPAHGLKVKNSIPQLMKALPPLPPGISTGEGQNQQRFRQSDGRVGERRQFDCSRLHDAIQRENEVYLSEPMPNEPRKSNSAKQNSPSKFKVRVKPSDSPLIGSGDIDLASAQGIQGGLHFATAPKRPKLKLKLSRSQFGQGRGAAGEALARVNRLKQCNSLADLALYSNIRTTAGQRPVNEDSPRGDVESEENVRSSLEARSAQSSAGDKSPQPSDPFSIPYPASPGDNTSNKRSLSSSNKDTLVQRTSCSSDRSPVQESGLRKKVSMFRLRIAESFTANSSKKSKKIEELERSDSRLSVKMTLGGSETNLGNMDNNHTPRSTSNIGSDWVTRRVKRWATDARRVLRSYVRRTLDRSSRWSE